MPSFLIFFEMLTDFLHHAFLFQHQFYQFHHGCVADCVSIVLDLLSVRFKVEYFGAIFIKFIHILFNVLLALTPVLFNILCNL